MTEGAALAERLHALLTDEREPERLGRVLARLLAQGLDAGQVRRPASPDYGGEDVAQGGDPARPPMTLV